MAAPTPHPTGTDQKQIILVIGLGNRLRGDDGIGAAVARAVSARMTSGVLVQEATGDMAELLEAWSGHQDVIIVDAMRSGQPPGTLRWIDLRREPFPAAAFPSQSTHDLGLAAALAMAEALGQMPARVGVLGIEAGQFDAGAALSESVGAAVGPAAELITQRLREWKASHA
jgi:hydrogenase maturation protease